MEQARAGPSSTERRIMGDENHTAEVPRLTSPLSLVLLALAVGLAVLAVALPVIQATRPDAVATVDLSPTTTAATLSEVSLPTGQVTATGDDRITVNLVVTQLPDGQPVGVGAKVMTQLGTSLWLIGLAVICFLLARVLADIAAGRPFESSQSRRFTLVAVAIVVCSAGADTVNYLQARLLTSAVGDPSAIVVTPYYSLIPLIIAAVCLVLAGAFRSGRRIQDDTEGLV